MENSNSRRGGLLGAWLAGAAVLVGLDQLIKAWAAGTLSQAQDIRVIPGVLHLLYRENPGAAFSILQGKTAFLIVVTSAVLLALLVLLLTRRVHTPALVAAFSLVVAGGLGNLIDRVARGFVIDYIYFVPIDFPVFNLADCCVVGGTALIVIDLLFLEPRREKKKTAPPAGNAGGDENPPAGAREADGE